MSLIPYTVEGSCAPHPLMNHSSVPRNGSVRISAKRLFAIGSLIFQDVSIKRKSYDQTQSLWNTLNKQYGEYLSYSNADMMTIATGEHLTRLSEIVGIACGLAVIHEESKVNLNRFRRFRPREWSGKRVDFVFSKNGSWFYHETKGTTYKYKLKELRKEIRKQKRATKRYCSRPENRLPLTAATGSIVVYRHQNRANCTSHIYLIDPPVVAYSGEAPRNAELLTVLKYYQNLYSVTHVRPQNEELIGLSDWLADVIQSVETDNPLPLQPPSDRRLITSARVSEPEHPNSEYKGTLFDARIARRSIEEFRTFEEATDAIPGAVTFLGVSQKVTSLIEACRWEELLLFRDTNLSAENESREILDSGVVSKKAILKPEEEQESKRNFNQQRNRI